MNYPLTLLLLGLLFTVLFGVLTWLRREGISIRFAIESTLLSIAGSGLAALTAVQINPVYFLGIIYVITMRVRILVDLGVLLANRKKLDAAGKCFDLALRLWPDLIGRTAVQLNQGVLFLQQGDKNKAVETFKEVLAVEEKLGPKTAAAAHYNLAMAYFMKGQEAQASAELLAAVDAAPGSEYARRAEHRLESKARTAK